VAVARRHDEGAVVNFTPEPRVNRRQFGLACSPVLVSGAIVMIFWLFASCQKPDTKQATRTEEPGTPAGLVICDWAEGGFKPARADFEREYVASVRHEPFESQEEVVSWLRAGKRCDVAIIESQLIPGLVAAGLLAEIDFRNVPNFKNVSASFRGLATDPGNRHTVPYTYGTTGILVRTDLAGPSVSRWADLWDPRFAGRVAIRAQMRELVGLTLLALGHPPNSEEPRHLEEALAKMLQLKKTSVITEDDPQVAASLVAKGKVWLLEGFGEDYRLAKEMNPAIAYVFPAEGILLWSDNVVIPSSGRGKALAEAFIDFMLRPEIAARGANSEGYPVANEAAQALLKPELRNDPTAYPPLEKMRRAHFFTPLSPEGERRYAAVWERFLADGR
jgi:spermidine/putrescine transport system substrate-binding protein